VPGGLAQRQAVQSPEVHADRTVTFRFRAPNAKEVSLGLEGAKGVPMQKGEQGVWSATTGPLEPDFYDYSFSVDGVDLHDPSNPEVTPNLISVSNEVHVPGPASLPWEVNDVPHGALHRHFYKSGVVGDNRDSYVYTPPAYDPAATTLYPVLYLLHGFSDDARGWAAVGRANVILDNLIAQAEGQAHAVGDADRLRRAGDSGVQWPIVARPQPGRAEFQPVSRRPAHRSHPAG